MSTPFDEFIEAERTKSRRLGIELFFIAARATARQVNKPIDQLTKEDFAVAARSAQLIGAGVAADTLQYIVDNYTQLLSELSDLT